METFLIGFFFLVLSFIGYSTDKKLLNPLFIVPFLWGMLLLMFSIFPHQLYELKSQFLLGITIWVMLFFVGGLFFVNGKTSSNIDIYNKKVFNIYFYIVIIFSPLAIGSLIVEAMKVGPEFFFFKLRIINTGLDEDDTFTLGKLGYIFNFTNVVCLIYTFYYEKIKKWRYYIVLFFAFLLGVITLARTSLVVLSISIFVILSIKGLIKKKHYFYFLSIFFLFILLITSLRNFHESDESEGIIDTFSIYLFSGMPAFDTVLYMPSEVIGENVFRFVYAISNSLGFNNVAVEKTILEYAYVPTATNVYTVLYPFYKDFGYFGIGMFALIYGFLYGIFYKYYKNKSPFFILLYAMFLPYLFIEFSGEFLFANLSSNLQMAFFLLLPYFLKLNKK